MGYHGVFTAKLKAKEGLSTFFDVSKFRLLRTLSRFPKEIFLTMNIRSVIDQVIDIFLKRENPR